MGNSLGRNEKRTNEDAARRGKGRRRGSALYRGAALMAGMLVAPVPAALANPATDRVEAQFERIVASPPHLRVFLQQMPKGGDLHNHVDGTIYAEDMLRWAAEKNDCLTVATMTIGPAPCDGAASKPVRGMETRDPDLYARAIDGLSTRGFANGVTDGVSGHDRFFRTFGRFGFATRGERGQMIAIAREQAAYDHESYLELMGLPSAVGGVVAAAGDEDGLDEAGFAPLLAKLAPLLPGAVATARADLDGAERVAAQQNGCKPDAVEGQGPCAVTVRYMLSVLRNRAPAQVFAQMAFSFALADADPRYVGVNIVAPEDGPVALRDYGLHMRMFRFFAKRYPKVALSLHAGELSPGMVPPRDLRAHIRDAIEVGGARRIGHGVDIAYEDDAAGLLARMARDRIAVEINLTSNDVILGISGRNHPLRLYRDAGVPVVLSTDDAGVSRTDLTNEYMRAVTEQGMRYADLKQAARNSITYAFLPGESIWQGDGATLVPACAGSSLDTPAPRCKALLQASGKAREQWRLERQLAAFEATVGRQEIALTSAH